MYNLRRLMTANREINMEASNKKHGGFKKVISEISEAGRNTVRENFLIHTVGSGELVLESYKGITEYSSDCVRIKTNRQTVKICGRNLEIANMVDEVVCVTGVITSIHFE